jgi:hypothetical protein
MSNRKCWARSLGECAGPISGEHIVTAGLFDSETVTVRGFSWCVEPKKVGLAGLTRKILCRKHNSGLSIVDSCSISTFKTFRECGDLSDTRQKMKDRHWSVVRREIDGTLLERWFLKTLINLSVDGEYRIGPLSSTKGEPADNLVRIAYGLEAIRPKAGLYASLQPGDSISPEIDVEILPFFDTANEFVMGGRFFFRGWRVMLFLGENGLAPDVKFVLKDGSTEKIAAPMYHPHEMKFTNGNHKQRLSQVVRFNWSTPRA